MFVPVHDEIDNVYSSSVSAYAHLYNYEHNLSPQFSTSSVSNACLFVRLQIPVALNAVVLNNSIGYFKIHKLFSNGPKQTHNILVNNFFIDFYDLIGSPIYLTPGAYVFEINGTFKRTNNSFFNVNIPFTQNKFIKLTGSTFTAYNNTLSPASTEIAGFESLSLSYRVIDTYLGLKDDIIHPSLLIPGAWYHLFDGKVLKTILYNGDDILESN
ncbi:MAG: hypothetical protein RBS16_01855 [Candidatus Cloacimonadales bacterium]|jgi:hypothetical protein|nr:hypothetical protein [Candidatus Cloacimonadota bacterium]MDD3502181.1 hypothetical protein [Candidatus Cloacimonadota bacterium]MDX9976757.1 hypothetical protein [Candidatus Cloacimonadales bacterium]